MSKKRNRNRQHARRQQQQQQQQQQPTTTTPTTAPQSGGLMSWLFGSSPESESELKVEHETDLFDSDKESEGESGDKTGEGSGWLSWLPSIGWSGEHGSEGQLKRKGDDDNHIDLLSTARKGEASLKLGAEGAKGEAKYEASGAVLSGEGKQSGNLGGALGLEGTVEGSVLSGGVSGEIEAKLDQSGLDAKAKAEIGAYLAKGEAGLEAAIKIPWINAVLFGSASGEGQIGMGASAEGELQVGGDGFAVKGKAGGSAGLGGKLGLGFGLKKADSKKGWFDWSASMGN
jgi:hypothetical protein